MTRFSKCVSSLETLFGLTLDQAQRNGVRTYLRLLAKWDSRVNLTRVARTDDRLRFHFFESFWLAQQFLDPRHTIADVGSGAGFPGLAMQLYRPSLSVTLIERSFKKTVFLKEVARALSLRARIVHGEAETVADWKGIQLVTIRGLKPSPGLTETLADRRIPLLALHGEKLSEPLKGRRWVRRERVPGSRRRYATLFG
ncbi:MAG: 16S rRNA (guanine(527)-N(7))-methyltransferase RsmG [Acidobacteriota bacterium]|nr:16S rRNA (guanine(527)-N(7))-methyltransferase RsmG [Acidobacteriota bacterium]